MRVFGHVAPLLVLLAVALWLGGLAGLLLAVNTLFGWDRAVAAEAAPRLFAAFEPLVLVVAAVAIAGTVGWRLIACTRAKRLLMLSLLLAGVAATLAIAVVSPRIEYLRLEGYGGTEHFRRWHGISMLLYSGQFLLVLVGACLLPWAVRSER